MGVKLEPQKGFLILVKAEKETKTRGGIVIPTTAKDEDKATVLSVGPDSIFSEGDVVYFDRYEAKPIEVERKAYILIREGDIYCRVLEG